MCYILLGMCSFENGISIGFEISELQPHKFRFDIGHREKGTSHLGLEIDVDPSYYETLRAQGPIPIRAHWSHTFDPGNGRWIRSPYWDNITLPPVDYDCPIHLLQNTSRTTSFVSVPWQVINPERFEVGLNQQVFASLLASPTVRNYGDLPQAPPVAPETRDIGINAGFPSDFNLSPRTAARTRIGTIAVDTPPGPSNTRRHRTVLKSHQVPTPSSRHPNMTTPPPKIVQWAVTRPFSRLTHKIPGGRLINGEEDSKDIGIGSDNSTPSSSNSGGNNIDDIGNQVITAEEEDHIINHHKDIHRSPMDF